MTMVNTKSEGRVFTTNISKNKYESQVKIFFFFFFGENSVLNEANIHCILVKVQFSFLSGKFS